MAKRKVLMPLPSHDFDPTEASISWKIIRDAGHEVVFATEDGKRAHADPRMISGEGLDPWGFVPVLNKIRLIGLLLRARPAARRAYREMEGDPHFLSPLQYEKLDASEFDGLVLPGGHAGGMRQYLESEVLQRFVADFFEARDVNDQPKPVGAVCHGVVLAARSTSRITGRSVLHGKKTTGLTWSQERAAWRLTKYFARFWDSTYYRTYSESADEPVGYRSVESEVKRALENESDFLLVPTGAADARHKTDNMKRDSLQDSRPAWVVRDGSYISARWPGDVHTFARAFVSLLEEQKKARLAVASDPLDRRD